MASPDSAPKTVRADDWIAASGIARLEAQVLLAHALGKDRAWVLAHPEASVPDSAEAFLARRRGGEPLAYITREREFFGRSFFVAPGVLIPRQETEDVLELAMEFSAESVLDLGCGSGCIGLTYALETCRAVTLSDISRRALAIARVNRHRLGAQVALVHSDLAGAWDQPTFDLLISNPPYVADDDELPEDVRYHEPEQALFSGPKGTEFYERLAQETPRILKPGGVIVLEIGRGQEADIRAIFVSSDWEWLTTRADLAGIPRGLAFKLS